MINATALPSLLAAASSVGDDHFDISGSDSHYLASVNGAWGLSPDSDLFHIHAADLAAIQGASAGDIPGTLKIGGVDHEVAGYRSGGVRWIVLREPEE